MEPKAHVWRTDGTDDTWITIEHLPSVQIVAREGYGSHVNIKGTSAQMRVLVDQIVKGLAKLEKPKGEGA